MDAVINTPTPAALRLRPYQDTGVRFLLDRRFALLGDAMGLGKTPQYLRAAAALMANDPAARVLICAPAATLPGLDREVRAWTGAAPVTLDAAGKVAAPDTGIILIAWTSVQRRVPDLLWGPQFAALILDEAHRVKNPKAAVTRATLGAWRKVDGAWVRSPSLAGHADRVWAATGTPIPNRPIEIQPLLLMAGGLRWAAKGAFGDRFCKQPNRWSPSGYDLNGARNLDELHDRLTRRDGVLLRRLPEDVPGELPTLTVAVAPLAGVRDAKAIKAAGLDPDAIADAVRAGETLPFEELAAYRAAMGEAKTPAVAAWVKDWMESNEDDALVVFVWHRAVAAALAEAIGVDDCFVATGDDAPDVRQRMVDAFANGERRVFIGSIAACGTGLNGLHRRTTHCAFGEVAWTPGELTQAIGRIRRFGSAAGHATATILVGEDTLEDHILQVIADKIAIANDILGDTTTGGSTAAAVNAPALVVAAPTPAPAETVQDDVDPTTLVWGWARLRSGDWGVRTPAAGDPAWTGAVITVRNRAGQEKRVVLGGRVACGGDWSIWEIDQTILRVTAQRDYLGRRFADRGVDGVLDETPLTDADDQAAANALHAAAYRLTGLDLDRATARNGIGWNQADGTLGRILADTPPTIWTRGTLTAARALLRTYSRTQATDVAAYL